MLPRIITVFRAVNLSPRKKKKRIIFACASDQTETIFKLHFESKDPPQTLHNDDDDDDNVIYSVRLLLIGMTEPQNQIMKPLFK